MARGHWIFQHEIIGFAATDEQRLMKNPRLPLVFKGQAGFEQARGHGSTATQIGFGVAVLPGDFVDFKIALAASGQHRIEFAYAQV